MAWKEVSPMLQRAMFVLEAERKHMCIAELCRRYGVSRKTGYKWIGRYMSEGLDGIRGGALGLTTVHIRLANSGK